MLESISLFHPNERTCMARIISHYRLLQSTAKFIYLYLNTQSFMISIVHEYLYGSSILLLQHPND